jgi:putative ABC transport system permease protein
VKFVEQQRVSAGFVRVLGIPPMLGREFSPQDDRAGGRGVAVLCYALGLEVFAGDSSAFGDTIELGGAA